MGYKLYNEDDIQSVADAIRAKNGKTDKYKLSEMAAAVGDIDLNAELINMLSGEEWQIKDTYGKITTYAGFGQNNALTAKLTYAYMPECTKLSTYALGSTSGILKEVYLPKCATFGDWCLENPGIEKITLSDNIDDTGCGFLASSKLEELNLGTVGKTRSGFAARMSNVKKISMTKCTNFILSEYWGNASFANCPNLKIVDFGILSNIYGESGKTSCWSGDTSLKAVVIRNVNNPTNLTYSDCFKWIKDNLTADNFAFYVTDALVDKFKAATNWSDYADYFKPLSEYDESAILAETEASSGGDD